jgi:hypothetical protein
VRRWLRWYIPVFITEVCKKKIPCVVSSAKLDRITKCVKMGSKDHMPVRSVQFCDVS